MAATDGYFLALDFLKGVIFELVLDGVVAYLVVSLGFPTEVLCFENKPFIIFVDSMLIVLDL